MRKAELATVAALQTVATLQKALDAAHERNRELEETARAMNERYAQALAERDQLEIKLYADDGEARRRG
jgi:hypothetical protein